MVVRERPDGVMMLDRLLGDFVDLAVPPLRALHLRCTGCGRVDCFHAFTFARAAATALAAGWDFDVIEAAIADHEGARALFLEGDYPWCAAARTSFETPIWRLWTPAGWREIRPVDVLAAMTLGWAEIPRAAGGVELIEARSLPTRVGSRRRTSWRN